MRRSRLLFAFPRRERLCVGDSAILVSQPSPLGKGDRAAVDRVLSLTAYLRQSFPLVFHSAFPIQPPPLRGTSFQRKEGVSTLAPSLGRGCRAQRGGVGFPFCGEAASSLPSPSGKGDRVSGARVLSQTAYLRRSPSLSFIPLEPYPARSARHLPHAGKAVSVDIVFPHMRIFALAMREKQHSRIVSLPHWGRGTAQRWIGCFRISST